MNKTVETTFYELENLKLNQVYDNEDYQINPLKVYLFFALTAISIILFLFCRTINNNILAFREWFFKKYIFNADKLVGAVNHIGYKDIFEEEFNWVYLKSILKDEKEKAQYIKNWPRLVNLKTWKEFIGPKASLYIFVNTKNELIENSEEGQKVSQNESVSKELTENKKNYYFERMEHLTNSSSPVFHTVVEMSGSLEFQLLSIPRKIMFQLICQTKEKIDFLFINSKKVSKIYHQNGVVFIHPKHLKLGTNVVDFKINHGSSFTLGTGPQFHFSDAPENFKLGNCKSMIHNPFINGWSYLVPTLPIYNIHYDLSINAKRSPTHFLLLPVTNTRDYEKLKSKSEEENSNSDVLSEKETKKDIDSNFERLDELMNNKNDKLGPQQGETHDNKVKQPQKLSSDEESREIEAPKTKTEKKSQYKEYLEKRYQLNYKNLDTTYYKQSTQLHFQGFVLINKLVYASAKKYKFSYLNFKIKLVIESIPDKNFDDKLFAQKIKHKLGLILYSFWRCYPLRDTDEGNIQVLEIIFLKGIESPTVMKSFCILPLDFACGIKNDQYAWSHGEDSYDFMLAVSISKFLFVQLYENYEFESFYKVRNFITVVHILQTHILKILISGVFDHMLVNKHKINKHALAADLLKLKMFNPGKPMILNEDCHNNFLVSLGIFNLEFNKYRNILAYMPKYDLADPEVMSMIMESCLNIEKSPIFKKGNSFQQTRILFNQDMHKKIIKVKGKETSVFGCVACSLEDIGYNKLLVDDLEELDDAEDADYLVSLDSNVDLYYEDFELLKEDLQSFDAVGPSQHTLNKDGYSVFNRKASNSNSHTSNQSSYTAGSNFSMASRNSLQSLMLEIEEDLDSSEVRLKLLSYIHLILIHARVRRLPVSSATFFSLALKVISKLSSEKLKYRVKCLLYQYQLNDRGRQDQMLDLYLRKCRETSDDIPLDFYYGEGPNTEKMLQKFVQYPLTIQERVMNRCGYLQFVTDPCFDWKKFLSKKKAEGADFKCRKGLLLRWIKQDDIHMTKKSLNFKF